MSTMQSPTVPSDDGTARAGGPDHRDGPRPVLEGLLGATFSTGNRVDVLRNGVEAFPAMVEAISTATRSVDLLWFSWGEGDIAHRLAGSLSGRARRGVRVRMLLDAFGAQEIDGAQLHELRDAGCHVLFYRPFPVLRFTTWNLRTHRRVLVCDESTAFTGGMGVTEDWTGDGDRPHDWRDTAFRVRGPAVTGLRSAFAIPWLQAVTSQGASDVVDDEDRFPPLEPAGHSAVQVLRATSQPGWNESAVAVAALLRGARTRVRVATPYVRLPGWLRELFCATAGRGVQVQLLVAGPHVQRPSIHRQAEREFDTLLAAGIEIWRYQPSLMHTKVITVDGTVAMGGTANLDVRSMALNEQVSLVIDDPAVVRILDDQFDEDLTSSERVDLAQWRSRPLTHRLRECTANAVGRPLRGWQVVGLGGRRP